MEQNLISIGFFEKPSFKNFHKSIQKLSGTFSTDFSFDKLLTDFNIPYAIDLSIKKPNEENLINDLKKLQTSDNINFTKDLLNLKSSLFREAKKENQMINFGTKLSSEKLKSLEIEVEALKSQITQLKQVQEKNLEIKEIPSAKQIPDGFERTLRLLTKFNDIVEDRINNQSSNKMLKEFEAGNESIKELGTSLKEILIEQKGIDKNSHEIAILMGVEILLGENKVEEGLKLVRWRKKILKLMEVCGWDVATEISRKTMKKLEVGVDDIISATLEMSEKDDNNLLSSFIEN